MPKYHYFCDDDDANLPDTILLALSAHNVKITREANDRDDRADFGVLKVKIVPDTGGRGYLVLEDRPDDWMVTQEAWRERSVEVLSKAAAAKADVLCFPEFGCPFGVDHSGGLRLDHPDDDQLKDVRRHMIMTSDVLLCLGSSHRYFKHHSGQSWRTKNVSVTYGAGGKTPLSAKAIFDAKVKNLRENDQLPDNFIVEVRGTTKEPDLIISGSASSQNEQAEGAYSNLNAYDMNELEKSCRDFFDAISTEGKSPVFGFKKSPARKLGEYMDSSGLYKLDVFVTPKGVYAVLICFDAYDPTLFMSAVRMQMESERARNNGFFHQGIDVFLIPSFNRSPKLIENCKLLSREANAVVAYVSADGDGQRTPRHQVFCYGFTPQELKMQMGGEPEFEDDLMEGGTLFRYWHHDDDPDLHFYELSNPLLSYGKRSSKIATMRSYRRDVMAPSWRRRLGDEVLQ